jgi:archaellum component FlaC
LEKIKGLLDDAVASGKNAETSAQELLSKHSLRIGTQKKFIEEISSSASALSESIKELKNSVEQFCVE